MHDVGKVAVIIETVAPVAVVNVAIAVIVDSVVVAIGFVSIHIGAEVLVVDIQSGIDEADNKVTAPGRNAPCFERVNIRTRLSRCGTLKKWVRKQNRLPGIVHDPQVVKIRVIRRTIERLADVVRLGIQHRWIASVRAQCRIEIDSGSELYKLQPGERRETAHHLTGSSRTRLRTGHLRCRWAIPNQKLVGNVLRCAIPHAASSEIRLLRRYIDRERYEKRRKDNPRSGAHGEDS